jgi:hypothetical protein
MAVEGAATGARAYWPSFLRGTANEILSRMLESDPLRLRERSARRLRERWLLVEPDRAHVCSVALVAKGAAAEDAPEDLDAWAVARVDAAIDQLVEADIQAEEEQAPLEEHERVFPLLTDALMLDPGRVRECAVAFNVLDPLPRRAFFELMIEGRQVPDMLETGPWDEDLLYRDIHLALAAFSYDLPDAEASTETDDGEKEDAP